MEKERLAEEERKKKMEEERKKKEEEKKLKEKNLEEPNGKYYICIKIFISKI